MYTYRLVYQSRSCLDVAFGDVRAEIDNILEVSRARNAVAGITGALMFNENCFTQILEGEETAVKNVFARIEKDKRHSDVTILFVETGAARQFGSWWMAFAGKSQAAWHHYRNIAMNGVDRYGLSQEPIIRLMLKMIEIDDEEMSRAGASEKLGQLTTLVARRWRDKANEVLEPLGLSAALVEPLLWLNRSGGAVRQCDLASLVGIESHSLSRIINQLQAKGLIEQRDDSSDRRVKIFQLTGSGSKIAARADEDLTHMRLRLLRNMPSDDIKEALRLLSFIEHELMREETGKKRVVDQ